MASVFFLYLKLIERSPNFLFPFLANLRSLLVADNLRWGLKGKLCWVTEDQVTWFFSGKSRGVKLFKNGIRKRSLSLGEQYLLHKLEFKDGDFVVDCGANWGDLFHYFTLMNVKIEYIGIEPSCEDFCALRRNISSGTIINAAASNRIGVEKLYLLTKSADSSLIIPAGWEGQYEEVEAVRIDSIDTLSSVGNIKLMKIEAEGFEPEVICGASGILDKVDFVTCDMGPERGEKKESTLVFVNEVLTKNGFRLIDFNHTRTIGLFERVRG